MRYISNQCIAWLPVLIRFTCNHLARFVCHISDLARQILFKAEKLPIPQAWFTQVDVAGYDLSLSADSGNAIDPATWRDLDLDAYSTLVAPECSIFGRQFLYASLRRGGDEDTRADFRRLSEQSTGDSLRDAANACKALRCTEHELTHAIFHGQLVTLPRNLRHVWLTAGLLLMAIALLFMQLPGTAACMAMIYLGIFAAMNIRFGERIDAWKRQQATTVALLIAARELSDLGSVKPHALLDELRGVYPTIKRLIEQLAPGFIECKPSLLSYMNIFFMYEHVTACRKGSIYQHSIVELQRLYCIVSKIEGRVAVLGHLREHPNHTWASKCEPKRLKLVDVINPLLPEASPLTCDLRGSAFISGHNGIGKSTLLRTAGLNLVTARAFGFCYARLAETPMLPVWTSVHNEDSLAARESLYMTEMRRAETLLAASSCHRAVYIIDVIFRGTNYLESAASAAAVLQYLANGAIVIVSSHNLVLASLLDGEFDRWRIVRGAGNAPTAIEPGVTVDTNGIAMMDRYVIPDAVRADARRFATRLLDLNVVGKQVQVGVAPNSARD
jgi:hypothetical protein